MFAKFDEISSMPFQSTKERPKRHGRTERRTAKGNCKVWWNSIIAFSRHMYIKERPKRRGQKDRRTDNVKTVYPTPTNTVCGCIIMATSFKTRGYAFSKMQQKSAWYEGWSLIIILVCCKRFFGSVCVFGFNVAFNNFSVISRPVWLRQGAQCSLFNSCLAEVSCPRHLAWYHTQSHYTDIGSTSPSSTP